MNDDLYAEKLDLSKQNEKPEVVLLLADNPELVKIVVAWTRVEVKQKAKLSRLPNDSEGEAWKWLWQNTNYRLGELKEKTGTSLSEIALENRMKPLIGNRIIYPDGTVNSFVERYLREQVVKLFETKTQKPARRN